MPYTPQEASDALSSTMPRYSVITHKRPREIVLLRGSGCVYKRCTFCDYFHDASSNMTANARLNCDVLSCVTGTYGELEVINSGSVFELDTATLDRIAAICTTRAIDTIHFESHYLYRNRIPELRRRFAGFDLKLKLGLETFDRDFRENVLRKGIPDTDPGIIARNFDEANLLVGLPGQTVASMERDIELGLVHFERICVNVMCANSAALQPDPCVVTAFMQELYPRYSPHTRIDILVENTDFGVGN